MSEFKEDTVVFRMNEGPTDQIVTLPNSANLNLFNISKEKMLRMIGYNINSGTS